jgi:hypothetical protein
VRPTPLLATAAAAALVASVAGPATAADPTPARGVASSSVTLLGVAAGGHTLSAGTLELLSDMLGAEAVAKVLLTPLTADGTAYGQQTVTPGSAPASAPSVSSNALVPALAGVASLTSPVLRADAGSTDGQPSTSAGADSLGGLQVLGLPISIDGGVDVGSAVTRTAGALGTQQLTVEDVALPSVADLLAALGLDLSKLPVEVLTELLTELDLLDPTVDAAQEALDRAKAAVQAQIDAAQAQVDAASAAVTAKARELAGKESALAEAERDLAAATRALAPLQAAVTSAQGQLTAANAAVATAQATLTSATGAVSAFLAATPLLPVPSALTGAVSAAQAALTAAQNTQTQATAVLNGAVSDLAQAQSAVDALEAVVTALEGVVATLQTALDGLQDVLDAAIAALDGVLDSVQAELDALLGAVTAVLDGTPLVSFDSLTVVSRAVASGNRAGQQEAVITGGEVSGLEVLGTDVLDDVLGTRTVDLLDLVGGTLDELNALVAGLTGTLSSVLSTVPAFPTLSIPAPQVGLLTRSASTSVTDGFGVAGTSIKGLSVTLPSVSIPTALALPGAADLPALDGITQVAGRLTSAPVRIDLATLTTQSRFAPAVVAAPGTGTPGTGTPGTGTPGTGTPGTGTPTTPGTVTPQLPRTGASQALAALGVALMAAAVVARRRSTGELV